MHLPIYLDYSATTPVDPRVAEKMSECLTLEGNFGNPGSARTSLAGKLKRLLKLRADRLLI